MTWVLNTFNQDLLVHLQTSVSTILKEWIRLISKDHIEKLVWKFILNSFDFNSKFTSSFGRSCTVKKESVKESIHSRFGANMESDKGEIMCFLRCPSFFAAAYTFTGKIVLVYFSWKKNIIAPYSLLLYWRLPQLSKCQNKSINFDRYFIIW